MIIRKEVIPHKEGMGRIVLPEDYIGKFVYVVTDEDFDKTYSLLDEAMIKLKVYQEKFFNLEKKFDEMYSIMNTRMTYIEKVIQNTCVQKDIKELAEKKETISSE